jgi:hypothetical protein
MKTKTNLIINGLLAFFGIIIGVSSLFVLSYIYHVYEWAQFACFMAGIFLGAVCIIIAVYGILGFFEELYS